MSEYKIKSIRDVLQAIGEIELDHKLVMLFRDAVLLGLSE